jgi:CRP-like cAMP-binding protein
MTQVVASFQVDIEHLHAMGVSDPYSPASMEIYRSGKLNSNERLYFSLWGSKHLSSVSFEAKKKVLEAGVDIASAYFVVSGSLLAIQGDRIERLGPGSVLGLAEGLAGIPFAKTVVTVTPVQMRILPLTRLDRIIPTLPQALREIIRTAVKRTLGVKQLPEGSL